jgi:ABC-type sugar transport system permease subunit
MKLSAAEQGLSANELAWISLYIPALVMFLVFVIFPLFQAIYVSFTDWDGIRPGMSFIGLENYRTLAGDQYILRTISTTFNTRSRDLAQNLWRWSRPWSSTEDEVEERAARLIFMPSILSGLIVGYIWSFPVFDPLMKLGKHIGWTLLANNALSSQTFAIYAAAFVSVWRARAGR